MKAMKAVTGDASTHPAISTGLFEHPAGEKENILCCKAEHLPLFVHVKVRGDKRAGYMESVEPTEETS